MSTPLYVRIAHIVDAVAAEAGMPKSWLSRPGSTPRTSRARYLAFLLARELGGFPCEHIGHTLRAHPSTVSTGAWKARRWLETEPEYRELRARVEARLCQKRSSTETKTV